MIAPIGLITSVVLQPDGKIIVGGNFANVDGILRNGLVRFESDGSVDQGFAVPSQIQGRIITVAIQKDGRVLISVPPSVGAIRLDSDGSLDPSFIADRDLSPSPLLIPQADG